MLTDDPVLRDLHRYEVESERNDRTPRCPVCGQECETVYKDGYHEILGCNECLTAYDAWDEEECVRRWDE